MVKLHLFILVIFGTASGAEGFVWCDVIIAGGSTSALAAATNAAEANSSLRICLTEPTDWLGGQLTSSGVSAVDFGVYNRKPMYQPRDFRDMLVSIGFGNPGRCSVSTKCFLPRPLVDGWIQKRLESLPNLRVLYNTVVKIIGFEDHTITNVTVITREPLRDQWNRRYSEQVSDWYNAEKSKWFAKKSLTLTPRPGRSLVVIDATEYGDVLVLSRAPYRQGVEFPSEDSLSTLFTCGQAITYPFYVQYNKYKVKPREYPYRKYNYSLDGRSWEWVWIYRRSRGYEVMNYSLPGDISNQNYGPQANDYLDGYVFLTKLQVENQINDWRGGLNVTTLADAELQAYGWWKYYRSAAPSGIREYLNLGQRDIAGTDTGLVKVPYIRDTRRSIGLGGFVLREDDIDSRKAVKFPDTIALGNYNLDYHNLNVCQYPDYLFNGKTDRFYIPFRALTNSKYKNLLVAGKTMAQTYHANAATRLHPEEWATGVAAGRASAMMVSAGLTSGDALRHIGVLQRELRTLMPLDWKV